MSFELAFIALDDSARFTMAFSIKSTINMLASL